MVKCHSIILVMGTINIITISNKFSNGRKKCASILHSKLIFHVLHLQIFVIFVAVV